MGAPCAAIAVALCAAIAACSEKAKPPAKAEAPPTPASSLVDSSELALCEAVRDANPARCGDPRCTERYDLIHVLMKDVLGGPHCDHGSKDWQQICKAATDRHLWECHHVTPGNRPLCDALASHDANACHPGGGRECVDLFYAAAGVSRGDFGEIEKIREPGLRVAAKAALGRLDCAEELRRASRP